MDLRYRRGAFLNGKSPYPYISAFNASLFLSATEADVRNAIDAKLPAGLVLPTSVTDEDTDSELRVAFDFDGVIIDDEAEAVFQEKKISTASTKARLQRSSFLTILAH